jgi:hypothetical protein
MNAWRRIGALLTAGAVAALAVTSAHAASPTPTLLNDPITVVRDLSTTSALFGDPVGAEIDVYTDARRVPAGSVRLRARFGPYRAVSTTVEHSSRGGLALSRTRITLQCLTRACLPEQGKTRIVRFPAATITYVQDGRARTVAVPWQPLQVSSRVPAGAAAGLGLVDAAPRLDPGFARPPWIVRTLLLVAAALLGIIGAWLLVSALWPSGYLSGRRWRRLSPLERSLERVEAAARSDDEGERRRTLDELATRLADVPAPALEGQTRALAWGASPPRPEALTDIAGQVRTTLNGEVRR